MPLVATFLFYRADEIESAEEDALWPRLLPGLYISFLGCISLYCISYVVRHPHDVRTGDKALRKAVERENRKYKKASKVKKKKRKNLEKSLKSGDGIFNDSYIPPDM